MKPFIYSLCVWLCATIIGFLISLYIVEYFRLLLYNYYGLIFEFALVFSLLSGFIFSIPSLFLLALLTNYLLKTTLNHIKIKTILSIFSVILVAFPIYFFFGKFNFKVLSINSILFFSYYIPTLMGLWIFKLENYRDWKSLINITIECLILRG